MRSFSLLALACLGLFGLSPIPTTQEAGTQSGASAQPQRYALAHVAIIDGTGAALQEDMAIIIAGERIAAVLPTAQLDASDLRVVDCSGQYAYPGLWDLHVHHQELEDEQMALFPAYGVTSIRGMGNRPEIVDRRRSAIAAGEIIGPRLKSSIYMIDEPVLMGQLRSLMETQEDYDLEMGRRIVVRTPEEGRAAVRKIKAAGADFVKMHTCASREVYLAVGEEAASLGLTVAGHDPLVGTTIEDWLSVGQTSIDHIDGTFVLQLMRRNEEERAQIMQAFVHGGLHFVPTLVVFDALGKLNPGRDIEERLGIALDHPQSIFVGEVLLKFWKGFLAYASGQLPTVETFAVALRQMRGMFAAGVRIMPGTDMGIPGVFAGYSLHRELELFVEHLGMTPMQAIECGARVPAEFFGMEQDLGTIEASKIADIVLVSKNPLEDIRHTRSIESVVLGGEWFDRARLDEILEDARQD